MYPEDYDDYLPDCEYCRFGPGPIRPPRPPRPPFGPGPGGPGGPGGPPRPPVGPGPGGPGGPGRPPGGPGRRPPQGPPPGRIPRKPSVGLQAVSPGSIRFCLFRFTYVWLRNGRDFWMWPIQVDRYSISGFRWNGRRWVYVGIDLRRIDYFQC